MTTRDHAPGYVSNPSYSREDWDDVCDNPEVTAEDFARAKPLDQVLPDLATAIRRTRGERTASAGDEAMVRLDPRVVDHFKATGEGWQDRINTILLKAAGL